MTNERLAVIKGARVARGKSERSWEITNEVLTIVPEAAFYDDISLLQLIWSPTKTGNMSQFFQRVFLSGIK